MEIEGTIIFDLGQTEGVSKAGRPWKKKEWVLETPGMYPRRVKFHVFGDKVDSLKFEVGKIYAISFDLESREFNGRWYTEVSCYAARPLEGFGSFTGQTAMGQPQQPAMGQAPIGQPTAPATAPVMPQSMPPAGDPLGGVDNNTDDLPF